MKVGDLVCKVRGYGSDQNWLGVICADCDKRVLVLTEGELEHWFKKMIEVLDENT